MPTIRRATPDDVPELLRLIHALAAHHGDPPACDRWALLRDVFETPPLLTIFVAQAGSVLVGYAALQPVAQLQWGVRGMNLHHLFVAPDFRGTGLGSILIEQAQKHIVTTRGRFLTVSTTPENHDAQAFYIAKGFEQTSHAPPRFRLRL